MSAQVLESEAPTTPVKPTRAPRGNSAIDHARDITVRALLSKGLSIREVAGVLGIARSTVSIIIAKTRGQGEDLSGPRSARRDELAGKVLERFMEVGATMPKKRIRAADAAAAVKTYAGIAWPEEAPTGPSYSFTEVHIHEARIQLPGPAQDTSPCVELPRDTLEAPDPQSFQLLTESGNGYYVK